jgi:integrase
MPIASQGFRDVCPGFKWNRKTKEALFDVSAPGGKSRRRKIIPFESVEDAKAAFAGFRAEARKVVEGYKPGEMPTFAQYIERHLIAMCTRVKPSTQRNYEVCINHHLAPHFGATRINKIGELEIEEYVAWELRRQDSDGAPTPTSPAMINASLRVLRKVLHNARKRKLISDVPAIDFLPVAPLRNEFSPDEQDAYLAAFDDESAFRRYLSKHRVLGPERESKRFATARRFGGSYKPDGEAAVVYFDRFRAAKPWFVAALHTGLRRSDLTNLRWSDVNLREGFIRVLMQKTTKEALIPISQTLRTVFRECRERPVVSEYVFVGGEGRRFNAQAIDRYHHLALAIAGITRHVRVHDLRHSYGSTLASGNVSLTVIRDCMGHQSTKTTERYARPSAAAIASVTAALDRPRRGGRKDNFDTRNDTRPPKGVEQLIREQQPETNKATVSSGFGSILSGAVERI